MFPSEHSTAGKEAAVLRKKLPKNRVRWNFALCERKNISQDLSNGLVALKDTVECRDVVIEIYSQSCIYNR